MSDKVGYWWAAQRSFEQCSGGLSISEWCSADQDLCCGLCPNPPITGPGTAMVMTIGTLLTLLNILIWKSEAPYNLFFQILGTDYILADFLNRLIQKEGRLTAFHAAMVPLVVMSIVPSLIAAVTVEAEYFHNVSLVNLTDMQIARAMSAGQVGRREPVPAQVVVGSSGEEELDPESTLHAPPKLRLQSRRASRRLTAASTTSDARPAEEARRQRKEAIKAQRHERERRSAELDHARAELLDDPALKKRSWLPKATASILVIHLVVWAALFPFALFYRNPSQSNCDDQFNFRRYRLVLGVMTASFYLAALLFVVVLLGSFKTRRKTRRSTPLDVLESIGRIWTTFGTWVKPSRTGYSKPRERVRWTLALAAYLIWVVCYLGVYFSALNSFVLLGDNPFDFGQVAACFGTLAPFILIGRAYMDQKDGWKVSKEKWAKHAEEMLGEADEGKRVTESAPELLPPPPNSQRHPSTPPSAAARAPLPLPHPSSRPPPVNFNFSRPIDRQSIRRQPLRHDGEDGVETERRE